MSFNGAGGVDGDGGGDVGTVDSSYGYMNYMQGSIQNANDVLIFFTQSLRGRPAIVANGIRFLIMSETKNKILWRCSAMATKKIKCPARITMLKESPPRFIVNKAEHIHAELKRSKYGYARQPLYNAAKFKDDNLVLDGSVQYQIVNPSGQLITTATAHVAQYQDEQSLIIEERSNSMSN